MALFLQAKQYLTKDMIEKQEKELSEKAKEPVVIIPYHLEVVNKEKVEESESK